MFHKSDHSDVSQKFVSLAVTFASASTFLVNVRVFLFLDYFFVVNLESVVGKPNNHVGKRH